MTNYEIRLKNLLSLVKNELLAISGDQFLRDFFILFDAKMLESTMQKVGKIASYYIDPKLSDELAYEQEVVGDEQFRTVIVWPEVTTEITELFQNRLYDQVHINYEPYDGTFSVGIRCARDMESQGSDELYYTFDDVQGYVPCAKSRGLNLKGAVALGNQVQLSLLIENRIKQS